MLDMRICGPKLAAYGVLLGIWGSIMLTLLGLFFFSGTPILAEDIAVSNWNDELEIARAFSNNGMNCWGAALVYVGVLALSLQQLWMNQKLMGYGAA